jgi:glutaminyl-tRNA synthetase
MLGVAKTTAPLTWLYWSYCVREELNKHSLRVMGVLRPLRLIIDNYP